MPKITAFDSFQATFVKLMLLIANTANALNITPGPSSRVKTTLV